MPYLYSVAFNSLWSKIGYLYFWVFFLQTIFLSRQIMATGLFLLWINLEFDYEYGKAEKDFIENSLQNRVSSI